MSEVNKRRKLWLKEERVFLGLGRGLFGKEYNNYSCNYFNLDPSLKIGKCN